MNLLEIIKKEVKMMFEEKDSAIENPFLTYPEGWNQAVDSLEFLPEEIREGFLIQFITTVTSM
jgi:hypothetical protein